MSLINITGLTFCYEGGLQNVFTNLNLQLDTNWRLGLVGRNGRGKTTFLRLLLGELEYSGNISASVDFSYFPYPVDREKTCGEFFELAAPDCPDWRIARELSLLKLPEDILCRPLCTLSNGEQTKLQLAAMFLRENNFLLIDEPTNHLDAESRRVVGRYLAGKSGFIVASHDRRFLDEAADHIMSITREGIELSHGGFTVWNENRLRREQFELSLNQKLSREIDTLRESARRSAGWADSAERAKIGFNPATAEKSIGRRPYEGAKSKKLMKSAKSAQKRLERAAGQKGELLKTLEKAEPLKLTPETHWARNLVSFKDVSLSYGGREVCRGVSFVLENGERAALCGPNGCGKTSVLRLLLGNTIDHAGEIQTAPGLKISYLPQDVSGLAGSLDDYARAANIELTRFKTILRKLDFSREQMLAGLSSFSMGQKKKAALARSLCERAQLYVWDEPLNFIDIFSRLQIEQLILQYQPTLLFVEHDAEFCRNVATKTISL